MNDTDNSNDHRRPGNDRGGNHTGKTWIQSDRTAARIIGRPLRQFLHVETTGSLVLLVATLAALILANTALADSIRDFWDTELTLLEVGSFHLEETLVHWVNDGLMVVFFFVVGLEIKRELVNGELADRHQAALPAIAALGGMVIPALLYVVFNAGGDGSAGWGIPMATDIAFAIGVLALFGSRLPSGLKVFLLTLAVVDDIGAIIVIAIFYTEALSIPWLAAAGGGLVVIIGLRLRQVWYMPIYVAVGVVIWVATLESGVHATIAGVVLGLLTPATPLRPNPTAVEVQPRTSWTAIRATLFDAKETIPVAQRLQETIHPWSAFIILPLFAFANAGISLTAESLGDATGSAVTIGIIAGLVLGKPLGVVVAAWLAVRTGLTGLPRGITWRQIVGVGALSGIGFTVSLFITGLAFTEPAITEQAKIGVLVASAVAAAVGVVLLYTGLPAGSAKPHDGDAGTGSERDRSATPIP